MNATLQLVTDDITDDIIDQHLHKNNIHRSARGAWCSQIQVQIRSQVQVQSRI